MAYPPFVFGEASAASSGAAPDTSPPYVPDGGPCTYDRQRVVFRL